jgi:hypothetical protein
MLNVSWPNPFNTRFFLLQTVANWLAPRQWRQKKGLVDG